MSDTVEPGQVYEARYQTGNKIRIIGRSDDKKKFVVERLTGKHLRSSLTAKQILGPAWKLISSREEAQQRQQER